MDGHVPDRQPSGDSARIVCTLTCSDDTACAGLADAVEALATEPAHDDRPAPEVPPLGQLNLEQAMNARDAFFAVTVQLSDPVGRIAPELLSPTRLRAGHPARRAVQPGGGRLAGCRMGGRA